MEAHSHPCDPRRHYTSSILLFYVSLMNYTQQLTMLYPTQTTQSFSNKFFFLGVRKTKKWIEPKKLLHVTDWVAQQKHKIHQKSYTPQAYI